MTNVAISGLPAATSLTGGEFVPIVQAGVTSRTTINAISEFLLGTYIDARNYAIDPTGATDSSVGGNLAIIDAINQKKKLIWPSGLFKLNGPLIAFTGAQQSFQMYGQGGAAQPSDATPPIPQNPVGHPYDANTVFYTNYTNAPAIVTNAGRYLVLKDFAILGQNIAPVTASTLSTGPSVSQAAYITAGCQNGRYAPYCGIAFDPFSNSVAQTVTGITKATSAVVTVSTVGATNPFVIGQQIGFANVAGMTQINGLTGAVTAVGGSSGSWTATVSINSSAFTAYSSGGTAVGLPYNFGTISGIASSGSVTNVTISTSGALNPFQYGESVTFSGVLGMTQINGLSGLVTATGGVGPGPWTITVGINSSGFSPYTSSGQAVASDAYLSLAQYYQSTYANNGTYGCVVENVNISAFVVGVALGLSGNEDLTADITFRNVNVSSCDVCYAIGQGESRSLNIEYGNIGGARTGVDGINYGSRNGTPPQFLRINFGFLYRLIALSQSIGNCVLENCYAESIISIGQFGYGSASSALPLTFLGGDYAFGGSGWLQAPLLLETYGSTTFLGTTLSFVSEIDALNFVMPQLPILFSHCTFSGTSVLNVASHVGLTVDAGNGGYAKILECWMNGGVFGGNSFLISNDMGRSLSVSEFNTSVGRLAAIYQTYRVSNGTSEYIYLPYSSQPSIAVGNVSSLTLHATSVTFTCSSAAQLSVGDILFWQMLAQGYSQLKWSVPALKISGISGTSVTCSLLFDPAQYDSGPKQPSATQVAIAPNHWAPTQALTCTTNSTTTLSSVSPTTVLQDGDFVAGANIPANSRVVSGGGTSTVVISQAATSSLSGVALYFGRLNAPTLTPLF
jgi:hypothetical protein